MSVKSEEEVLQELMTGVTFPLKYLGSVTVIESLKKLTSSIERETLTRYCMYLVCKRLKLCSINSNCDTKLASKVGPVLIVDKVVELNIALNAFVILDEDGVRIIERHPIDYISFASPARNGIFCFVSNTCVKNGRRCLVFKEPDNSVKYIIDTMSKVFSVKRRDFDQNQLMKSLPLNISGFIDERYHEFAHLFQLAVSEGIETKIWFHGLVDRGHAEALLHREGDFLVRLSRNTVNNFVLSGYTKSTTKHFLLIDETDNKVRKHSQVFETIVQLVEYHRAWYVPLISEGSELLLIRPIARGTPVMRR